MVAGGASADDELRFRPTTPRAQLIRAHEGLTLAIPAGRAWGIESELRRLAGDGAFEVTLAVDDPAVREAFVRVAFYATDRGRPRQLETRDSVFVAPGGESALRVTLAPPDDAVAYRIRVLGRLSDGTVRSLDDAIRIRLERAAAAHRQPPSRLLPPRR